MGKTNKYAVTLLKNIYSDVWEYQTYYIDETNKQAAEERALSYYDCRGTAKVVACAKIKQN